VVETIRLESHIQLISPLIANNAVYAATSAHFLPFMRVSFKFSFSEPLVRLFITFLMLDCFAHH